MFGDSRLQIHVTLNEIWLYESDPNAPSTWSEPGGKQWQRSIRGRRNWDVELCPCAVIQQLRSVAFVWETKRPQADNSRSFIDRQVSCFQNLKIWIFSKFLKFFGLDLKKKSTVLDGFFPYLIQMITSMRERVAYNDLWPWPISSRSFGLGLENRVRSVASTVLDGFFPYLIQMITSMRRCVTCDDLWP